jgi:hypothetical protein
MPVQDRFFAFPFERQPDILPHVNLRPLRPAVGTPQDIGTGGTFGLEEEVVLAIKVLFGSRRGIEETVIKRIAKAL